MNKINVFLIVCFGFLSLTSFPQTFSDTLTFFSGFGFVIKNIEITDTCERKSIVLNSKDGRFFLPKTLIINSNSKVFKVIVKYRFPFMKKTSIHYIKDFKTRIIYIRREKGAAIFEYVERWRGVI